MTVEQIIRKYLVEIGADGLCNPIAECGGKLDDLAPCECLGLSCKPGKKKFCDECPEAELCELEDLGLGYCIKPEV